MKRKILVTILILIMGFSIVACGKQETTATTATTESVPATVESTQAEPTETVDETTENTEETTEEIKETETENTEDILEAADITKGEPLSEKDLAFPVYGYKSYNEYIEAGNNGLVYMLADNANMIVTGELTLDPEDLDDDETNDNGVESTVRGIKLGDSIDKVFELYGQADKYDRCTKQYFAHDDLKDTDEYTYFLKLDSTKDYFYSLTFFTDQYSDVIGLIIEPIAMKYWSDDLT